MKKKIINTIWVMGVLALAGFCLSACNHELDIQQAYPFTVETMPVQKHIVLGFSFKRVETTPMCLLRCLRREIPVS